MVQGHPVAGDIAQIARRCAQQQLGKSAEGSSRGDFVADLWNIWISGVSMVTPRLLRLLGAFPCITACALVAWRPS